MNKYGKSTNLRNSAVAVVRDFKKLSNAKD